MSWNDRVKDGPPAWAAPGDEYEVVASEEGLEHRRYKGGEMLCHVVRVPQDEERTRPDFWTCYTGVLLD